MVKIKSTIKSGLVISGGGAWGAYGAGLLSGLNKDYDVIAGISTGALMSPLVLLKEFDILKEAYTSVNNSEIYDLKWYKPAPVTKKGKINILALIYALITGNESLATANQMRKTIDKFLTKEHYDAIRKSGVNIFVGGQNLREKPSNLHYFDIQDYSFEDFKDWMWVSAAAPFYTQLIEKEWVANDGNKYIGQWTDGGVSELVPLTKVFKKMEEIKCDNIEIDVVVHRNMPNIQYQSDKVKNLIENVNAVMNAMRYDIEFENILQDTERFSNENNCTVNVYFLPRKLSPNAMRFDKNIMKGWWDEGYQNSFTNENKITFKPKMKKIINN